MPHGERPGVRARGNAGRMFVALNNETGDRITSLAEEWQARRDELRRLTAANLLACPGCRQSVLFKCGEERRPHFAHRHLVDCPLAHQSAEVLEAKAQLYDWLCSKYPGKVELDLDQQIEGWKPFADLVVSPEGGKPFVYWVFDRQQRHRQRFPYTLEHNGKLLHVIHTQATYKTWSNEHELELTASQRDFTRFAPYDEPFRPCGHLYLLDTEKRQLKIYRGLKRLHAPNIFRSEAVRTGPLSQALISPASGEILFQADVEELRAWQTRLAAGYVSRTGAPPRHSLWGSRAAAQGALAQHPAPGSGTGPLAGKQPLQCEDCGVMTTDGCFLQPARGTCVCRSCLTKRRCAARREGS